MNNLYKMEKIKFYTQPSLDSDPELKVVIDNSGNLGIGELNPSKKLKILS